MPNTEVVLLLLFISAMSLVQQFYAPGAIMGETSSSVCRASLKVGSTPLVTQCLPSYGSGKSKGIHSGIYQRFVALDDAKNRVELSIGFLMINDNVAGWSAPLGQYIGLWNQIRKRFPFIVTFYFGYNNGRYGNSPTARNWGHGGSVVGTFTLFTSLVELGLKEAVLGVLKDQWGRITSWYKCAPWSAFTSGTWMKKINRIQ